MQEIANVIGRQRAKGVLSEICRARDMLLKRIFIGKDSQQHLQQKFERICPGERITNLYAPRIITNQDSEGQTKEPTRTISFPESRKSFKKGVRASNWQSYKKKSFADPNYVKKDIINLLKQRQKRSQTMESRVPTPYYTQKKIICRVHSLQIGQTMQKRQRKMSM